jgi:hypothetical protein
MQMGLPDYDSIDDDMVREHRCLTFSNPRFQPSPREKHRNGPLVFPVFLAELEHQFPLLQNSPDHEIDTDDHVDQGWRMIRWMPDTTNVLLSARELPARPALI